MSCLANAKELCQMMESGQMMEAFEKLYADDVVVIEATGETRNGKDAQREAIKEWQSGIQEYHAGGFNNVTANEDQNVSMIESWFDITFKDGNRHKMEEVGVQQWKDGKIVRERFYYNMPGQ